MTALGSDIQQLRLPLRQEASQRATDFVVSESNSRATSVLAKSSTLSFRKAA